MDKVFGIGFHKTGTTTLDLALKELGYNTSPVRTDLVKSLAKNNFNPTFAVAREFDAFQDNPWPMLYKKMFEEFPKSKFVLTLRLEEKWMASILNSFGGKSTAMREWIYGKGNGDPEQNESVFLEKYRRHNEGVVEFFQDKKDTLLVIDWEATNGWTELCSFLNQAIPAAEFPHANRGQYGVKEKKASFFKR
jgi:hypothetical protein